MKNIIILKEFSWEKEPKQILIGVESIIKVDEIEINRNGKEAKVTRIQSRGAMVLTTYVTEPLYHVYNQINK